MADDLISRKAAIYEMENVDWYHINKDGQLTHGANSKEDEPLYKAKDVYKVLNDMPSAQPERKMGHWVGAEEYCNHLNDEAKRKGRTVKYMPSGMVIGVYCDQCWAINTKRGNYCDNCGARMEGE